MKRWSECLFELCVCVFYWHVVEERCQSEKNSSRHTCKEDQLGIQKASNKGDRRPPGPALRGSIRLRVRRAQTQRDGQSIRDGVDLHVNGQAVQRGSPGQAPDWETGSNHVLMKSLQTFI